MHAPPSRRRGLIGALLLGAMLLGAASPAAAQDDLDQTIDPAQQHSSEQAVLSSGHVDIGVTQEDGTWALAIHDDSSTPPIWRDPSLTVLQVTDDALLEVPEGDTFSFLGVAPGTPVHVIPQTEKPGVVWVGWNTQDPALLDAIDLGVTLRVHAIEGPGDVSVYLQGGNFDSPQQLWSSRAASPQETWIETNTHTHANWVFTEPGVYLVDVEFAGDLLTGEPLSARSTLRFAVGSATDPAEALTAALQPADATAGAQEEPEANGPTDAAAQEGTALSGAWIAVGAGGVVLLLVVVLVSASAARARRRSRENGEHP